MRTKIIMLSIIIALFTNMSIFAKTENIDYDLCQSMAYKGQKFPKSQIHHRDDFCRAMMYLNKVSKYVIWQIRDNGDYGLRTCLKRGKCYSKDWTPSPILRCKKLRKRVNTKITKRQIRNVCIASRILKNITGISHDGRDRYWIGVAPNGELVAHGTLK